MPDNPTTRITGPNGRLLEFRDGAIREAGEGTTVMNPTTPERYGFTQLLFEDDFGSREAITPFLLRLRNKLQKIPRRHTAWVRQQQRRRLRLWGYK